MALRSKPFVALCTAAFLLSGCMDGMPSMGGSSSQPSTTRASLSSAEVQLRRIDQERVQQAERARSNQAAGFGAAAGALLGGALTALAGGSNQDIARNAALGGVAGGLAGAATGNYLNDRAREFGSAQEKANALQVAANNEIGKYRRLNATAAQLVNQQRAKVSALNARLEAGQISSAQYRSQIASASKNMELIRTQQRALDQQIAAMQSDVRSLQAGADVSGMRNQITELQSQRNTLRAQAAELAQVYNSVPDTVADISL